MLTINRAVWPSAAQFAAVISGMRNSWESWHKGDSAFIDHDLEPDFFDLGPDDERLALQLVKAGPDHAKYLRQLPIILDLTAPDYWWREFDTYRIGVAADDITQNSTSQMHVLGKHPFTPAMFSMEAVPPEVRDGLIATLNDLRSAWLLAGGRKGPNVEAWEAMRQCIPSSWNYTRTASLNYAAARGIYHARKNHRLPEWRTLCAALADAPYATLITTEVGSQ